ncbi:UbiA prenyltransferase family protein [Labilithrix luteola]|uniref:UbiA prenyltransferase family protein n=1 Tax=Labilithrix luteola TaxID=1391654 RepID=UPI001F0A7DC6|nr:UbiA prenyltransferase family protein [Labilithrix luteola]
MPPDGRDSPGSKPAHADAVAADGVASVGALKKSSVIRGLVKTIRPHQWVKNLFVMAPMFFHKDLFSSTVQGDPSLNLRVTGQAILGTGVFCLLAGAVYTINDLVDVEADRVHPVKRHRPIASGAVPENFAWPFAISLVFVALAISYFKLNLAFAGVALLYFVENLAYSFKLKKVAYLDVGLIAFGFVLRVVAGGLATNTQVSWYMIACTALLALFLGFGKRRHELEGEHAGKQRSALEAYGKRSLTIALAVTGLATAATYIAYTLDPSTEAFFQSKYLWLTAPFTVFGIVRFLFLVSGRAGRGLKAESPTQEMLSDVLFVLNLVLWVLVVVAIVYRLRPG